MAWFTFPWQWHWSISVVDTIRHKHTPIRKQGLGQSSTNGTHEDTAAVEELNKYEAVVGKNREKMIQTCQQTQYEK